MKARKMMLKWRKQYAKQQNMETDSGRFMRYYVHGARVGIIKRCIEYIRQCTMRKGCV
jgi:hypothetical protein